jgi:hypothetical protein
MGKLMSEDRREEEEARHHSNHPVLPLGPISKTPREVKRSQGPGNKAEDNDPARIDPDLDSEKAETIGMQYIKQ